MRSRHGLLLAIFFAATIGANAAPAFEDAHVVQEAVSGSLRSTIEELGRGAETWIAYAVPLVAGDHNPCCFDGRGTAGHCRLDDRNFSFSFGDDGRANPIPDGTLRVFLRVERREIDRVRAYGGNCTVDARGRTIHVIEDVEPKESVELLADLVRDENDIADQTLAAMSLHAEASAGRALFHFTDKESPAWLRAKAAFWLGSTRGEESLRRLTEMAKNDPSEEVREQAVFAVSVSNAEGSEGVLIDLARRDPRPKTRSTALFWLSQEASERVPETLRQAVDDDPNVEVKEQAVFALSQLPKDRGVPLLIDIARSSERHSRVRKAAIFWLGQSGDERALEFFEEVLK
jgi:HEAT repeat protein